MEKSQGNSLYSYLKQTKMLFFSQKWRTGGQNRSWGGWGGVDTHGRKEVVGRGLGG
jgi:hypothetical protein